MVRYLLAAVFLLFPVMARAQTIIYPPPVSGQGTATISTSAPLTSSNVTATTSSSAFPTGSGLPNNYLCITAESDVGVCWLGGTCTYATGLQVPPGQQVCRSLVSFKTTPPSVIAKTGSAVIELEW